MRKMLSLGAVLVSLCVLFSCSKDVQPTPDHETDPGPEPVHEVTTTIQGRVLAMSFTNLPNQPVAGALVKCGGKTAVTNKLGAFILKDVTVDKDAAVITVLKDNCFDVTRTVMIADEQHIQNVRIDLTTAYQYTNYPFSGASGGVVDIMGVYRFTFLPNQLLKEDNTLYTGQANVRVNGFATDNDIIISESYSASPGNLRAINKDGKEVLLQPHMTLMLDAKGVTGELLHFDTSGGKAVAFAIQTSADAPQTAPMWYFDASLAKWKEYGVATKTGDKFTGNIMHSSYLLLATEIPATTLKVAFRDTTTGMPWANKLVKVLGDGGHNAKAYTDASGLLSLLVPANEKFTLEMGDDRNYYKMLLSQPVDAITAPKDLGMLHLKAPENEVFTISGTVDGCNWAIPMNAIVNVVMDSLIYQFPVTGGQYRATMWSGTSPYTLFATDRENPGKEPLRLNVTNPFRWYDPYPHAVIRNLNTCGLLPGQFISYTMIGKSFSSVYPQDSTSMHKIDEGWYIDGFPRDYNSGAELSVYLPPSLAPGTYTAHTSFWEFATRASYSGDVKCIISKSGKPGEWIEGTFSGKVGNNVPPYDSTMLSGSYRYLIPQ